MPEQLNGVRQSEAWSSKVISRFCRSPSSGSPSSSVCCRSIIPTWRGCGVVGRCHPIASSSASSQRESAVGGSDGHPSQVSQGRLSVFRRARVCSVVAVQIRYEAPRQAANGWRALDGKGLTIPAPVAKQNIVSCRMVVHCDMAGNPFIPDSEASQWICR